VIGLLILAAASLDDANTDLKLKFDAYHNCVMSAASRLERSGETAPVVASSAIESCKPSRKAAQGALSYRNFMRDANATTTYIDDLTTRSMELLDERFRSEATLKVTEIRAAKRR
jgi:ABC-type molybdate transport system substrate-binding protein